MSQTTIASTDSPETGRTTINANFTELYTGGYTCLSVNTTTTESSGQGARYWLPFQPDTAFTSASQSGSPQFYLPFSGKLKYFSVMFGSNSIVTDFTVSVYIDGVITAMTFTFSNGEVLNTDTSTEVTVTAGQKLHFVVSALSGGGSFSGKSMRVYYRAF